MAEFLSDKVYVGIRYCGCITAISHDREGFDLADFTARMQASGRRVEIMPKEDALAKIFEDCTHG